MLSFKVKIPANSLILYISWLVDRGEANPCNFMYKRKNNRDLLEERPRQLRRYEADIFIEYHSNNNTFFQGANSWNAGFFFKIFI